MNPAHYQKPSDLEPNEDDIATLSAYLDQRRLLTTRLDIRAPAYRWVAIKAQLRATPGASQEQVEAEVLARLYRFLNPLVGGPQGTGWSFGRDLFTSDVYQSLQNTPNVQFIRGVEMYAANEEGAGEGKPIDSLEVVSHGVIASGIHEVEFV
jgi:hypothetical protein